MRPSLERLYMEFALMLSKRSTCKRLHVGTVITTSDLEAVIAIGYNGGAKGDLPLDFCTEKEGNCGCIHSEANALAKTLIKTRDKIFFITNSPCIICTKMIINSGALHVYYLERYRDDTPFHLLRQSNIPITQMQEASQAV